MSEWKAFAALSADYLGMPVEALPLYASDRKWSRNTRDSLRHLMIFPKDAFRVWVLRLREGVVQVVEKGR